MAHQGSLAQAVEEHYRRACPRPKVAHRLSQHLENGLLPWGFYHEQHLLECRV